MAQSNYTLANKSAPASRAKINDVFQSIATNNSGTAPPSTTFPHQWWYDTTTNILKQRNAADSAWIDIGSFDQGAGTFTPFGVVLPPELSQGQVQNSGDTTFGTVSGQRLAQAVNAFSPGVTTASVLNATAGASAGAVGTYAFLGSTSVRSFSPGENVAGSDLRYSAIGGDNSWSIGTLNITGRGSSNTPAGTWRCLGASGGGDRPASLFLRIS